MKPYIIFGVFILILIAVLWLGWEEHSQKDQAETDKLKSERAYYQSEVAKEKQRHLITYNALKAKSDTLEIERAKTRKKLNTKAKARETAKQEASEDLNKSPETIKNLVTVDEEFMNMQDSALNKCYQDHEDLKNKFIEFKSSDDSLHADYERSDSVATAIIEKQDKTIKKDRWIKRVLKVAVPVVFVIGVLVAI